MLRSAGLRSRGARDEDLEPVGLLPRERLAEQIKRSHERSKGTYGRPRVHADLKERGERAEQKRVSRLTREQGLRGASRRRRLVTTRRDEQALPEPDLVIATSRPKAEPAVGGRPTYIPTLAGFLYLAVVLDAWSRRVVGWAMAVHLRTQLVLDAPEMALVQGRPESVRPPRLGREPADGRPRRPSSGWRRTRPRPWVLSAAHDPISPPRLGRAIAEGIAGFTYVELADASHGVPIHDPETVNALLREHLVRAEAAWG